MISIDGSNFEGGGQILRTSIALSAISQKPVRIENIRAGRSNPGMKNQHFHAVKAAASICNAEHEGLKIGSRAVSFYPKRIEGGKYAIDVETAGAVTLMMQLLMPITLFAEEKTRIDLKGGTDVKWSPSSDYFKSTFLEFIKKFGINASFSIKKRGFYPSGGGHVVLKSFPWKKRERVSILERGRLREIFVRSIASEQLNKANVAERQAIGFEKVMTPDRKTISYCPSISPGSAIYAHMEYENLRVGMDYFGEKGKKAETVGRICGEGLEAESRGQGVDSYLSDQIVPYLAIAGGRVKASSISSHTKANVWVCQQFGYKIRIENNEIMC